MDEMVWDEEIWMRKVRFKTTIEWRCPYCSSANIELLNRIYISEELLKEKWSCENCYAKFVVEFNRRFNELVVTVRG